MGLMVLSFAFFPGMTQAKPLNEQEKVVVILPFVPFDERTPQWAPALISEILRNNFQDLRYAITPSEAETNEALNRIGITPKKLISLNKLKQFQSTMGADWLVLGGVAIKDQKFQLKIRVLPFASPGNGKNFKFDGKVKSLSLSLKEATAQIARACQISLPEIDKENLLKPFDFDYDALKEFSEARKENKKGNSRNVWELLGNIRSLHPQFIEASLELFRSLYLEQYFDSSIEVLREARKSSPHSVLVALQLGEVLIEQGNIDEAKEIFETILLSHPLEPHALYHLAHIFKKKGLLQLALESAQKGLRSSSSKDSFYVLIGDIHQEKRNFSFAKEIYQRALKINPHNQVAKQRQAMIMALFGDYDQAEELFGSSLEKPIQEEVPSQDWSQGTNESLKVARVPEETNAIEEYLVTVQKEPTNAAAFNELGTAYEQEKEGVKAEQAFRKAIIINPHFQPAYFNLAINRAYQGKNSEAERFFIKAINLNPRHVISYIRLGDLYWNLNKVKKAISIWGQGFAQLPKNEALAQKLIHGYARSNKWKKMIQTFKKLEKAKGENGVASLWIAQTFLQYGKDKKALSFLKKSIKEGPDRPTPFREMAVYYDFYVKNTEKALKYYEIYLSKELDLNKKKQVQSRVLKLKELFAQNN